jgi:hypothetical protein
VNLVSLAVQIAGAGISQSVVLWARSWTAEEQGFSSRKELEISYLHGIQTGSVAHPTSSPNVTGSLFPPQGEGERKRGTEVKNSEAALSLTHVSSRSVV